MKEITQNTITCLLTNVEYDYLLNLGGDGLVAFFAMLRAGKGQAEVIHRRGREGKVALASRVSGVSTSTVRKLLPVLLTSEVVTVHPNGNLAVASRRKTLQILPALNRTKLIPIVVEKSYTRTKTMVAYVRVHSNLSSQKRRIEIKAEQLKLLTQEASGSSKSLNDLKRARQLIRQGKTRAALRDSFCSISTISNRRFGELGKFNHKSGNYLKNKLLKAGLIIQERQIMLVQPGVRSVAAVKSFNHLHGPGHFAGKAGIYREGSPRIELHT